MTAPGLFVLGCAVAASAFGTPKCPVADYEFDAAADEAGGLRKRARDLPCEFHLGNLYSRTHLKIFLSRVNHAISEADLGRCLRNGRHPAC